MFKPLMRTQSDFAMFLVRLGLGASMLSHGLEKLGIWDEKSEGLMKSAEASAAKVAGMVGGDPWMGYLALAAETLGAAALILGFFGRFSALCLAGVMGAAAWFVGAGPGADGGMLSLENGAYLEWWRSTTGSYHILAILAALAIVIRGSGWFSIDRMWSKDPL